MSETLDHVAWWILRGGIPSAYSSGEGVVTVPSVCLSRPVMLLSLLCLLVPSPAPAQLRPRLQVGWLGYASQREALFVESVVAKSDAHFGVEGDIRLDVPLLIGVGGRWVATAKFSLDTVTAASGELRSWFSEAFLGHRLLNGRFGIQQRIFRGAFGERSWEF